MSSQASDLWNGLPLEVRVQALPLVIKTQANQIRIDQQRAKLAYKKYMSETNDHLKNLEIALEMAVKEASND